MHQSINEMPRFRPRAAAAVEECIRDALADKTTLELLGGGSKRAIGRPVAAAAELDLSGISGIRAYQPNELVMTAAVGTPLDEIVHEVTKQRQYLAFEPVDLRPLLGSDGEPTLGGLIGANLAGPRRIAAGSVRDHLLGLAGVTGRGEAIKAGGTVVKNVTGYDVPKLIAGAWGTLMALTSVSIKVLPLPARTATLVLHGLAAPAAAKAMSRALGGPVEVTGAAWLPEKSGASRTLLRLEADAASIGDRLAALRAAIIGETSILDHEASLVEWRQIGNVAPFTAERMMAVWRIAVPPMAGPSVVAALPAGDAYMDWGGGLVWARAPMAPDGGAAIIRDAVAKSGGHATLIRGEAALRRDIDVFQPLAPALAALSGRVKAAFDPMGVLNPGRLYRQDF